MKKTQFTDLITTIHNTIESFIAVVVFIALGLAFYGGIGWSVDHTEQAFTRTYQDSKMQTVLVTDPLGITEDQVAQLQTLDNVDIAEGCNIVYRFFHYDGVRQLAAVWQITERTDLLMNIEGELPTAAGETAVLRSWAEEYNIRLGDVLVLEDSDGVDYQELRIVRAVAQWDGESINSLPVESAAAKVLAENTLTVTAIVDSPVYLCTNPSAHGTCPVNGLYVDAVFFVSRQELLPDAFSGYTSVVLYNKELSETDPFSEEYRDRSGELSEQIQAVVDSWDRQLTEDFGKSVDKLRALLDACVTATGLPSEDGELQYAYLETIRQTLSEETGFCYVTELGANNSYLTADNLIGITKSVQSVLGITFLAVAVLICYSVISRLVADSAVLIGTRKALGFYRRDIFLFYLSYAGSAVLLGGIIGTVLGIFGIETAFNSVYSSMFTLTALPLVWNIADIIPAFLIVLTIILLVAAASCMMETRRKATDLLRHEQRGLGKTTRFQKSWFFRNLSLLQQAIVLNLQQDKRRVAGMIIGIAGAAALITAGISFYLNFTTAFAKQFTDYYRFDYQICYDASSDTASQKIREVLDRHNLDYAEIYNSTLILHTPDGGTNAPEIIVPAQPEDLSRIMFFDTETEKGIAYDIGVWMSDYYLYAFDVSTGSPLELETLDGKETTVPIDRFYRFHLTTPVVVMDKDTYRESFGSEAVPNSFYVTSGGLDLAELDRELQGIDGYIYTYNFYESFLSSFSTEEAVVSAFALLFILMAVLMALMILINLMNVYISEKKNELIILMINGYDNSFAKLYIYQDTIVLTLIGILIGLIAGSILGDRVLAALESDSIRMLHGICWQACLLASAAVAGLTILITAFALRKVDSFQLSDLNRM